MVAAISPGSRSPAGGALEAYLAEKMAVETAAVGTKSRCRDSLRWKGIGAVALTCRRRSLHRRRSWPPLPWQIVGRRTLPRAAVGPVHSEAALSKSVAIFLSILARDLY